MLSLNAMKDTFACCLFDTCIAVMVVVVVVEVVEVVAVNSRSGHNSDSTGPVKLTTVYSSVITEQKHVKTTVLCLCKKDLSLQRLAPGLNM